MKITPKQLAAMAAIILVGLLAGAAVLLTGQRSTGSDDGSKGAAPSSASASPGGEAHEAAAGNKGEAAASPAGSIRLTAEQQRAAGITTEPVGPKAMQSVASFPGEIHFNEDRTAHVVPRFAGVVEAVSANLGQQVKRGQVLAVIASTEVAEQRSEWLMAGKRRDLARSTYEREKRLWDERISAEQDYLQAQSALQEADIAVASVSQKLSATGAGAFKGSLNRFELRAPFDGTVVEKHVALGEAVKEDASVFTVADLGTVWINFNVPPQRLVTVGVGAAVRVTSTALPGSTPGTVSYVGALLGEQTRTANARVVLANREGTWRPGLFVTVSVLGASETVAMAVPADAVQTVDAKPTVFVADANGFAARAVKLGRADGKTVEILGGLEAGERVAVANSFVVKAELGKAGAAGGAD